MVYTIFGDEMKKRLKKIVIPIFLSVLCGFICGRLMFSIYEDKENKILTSSIVYLLEDNSYNDYDSMKASVLSSNYIYYEEDGKYNTVIGMTKDKYNIEKIKKVYDKEITVTEYLLNNDEINSKIEELDEKISLSNDSDEIRSLVVEMINIYKDKEDIKMVKIS